MRACPVDPRVGRYAMSGRGAVVISAAVIVGFIWGCGTGSKSMSGPSAEIAEGTEVIDAALGRETLDANVIEGNDFGLETKSCTPLEWVPVQGGEFGMGDDSLDLCDTGPNLPYCAHVPVHPVKVPSFQMNRTEVTGCQYQLCASTGTCEAMALSDGVDFLLRPCFELGGGHPVTCIDWNQSKTFCEWAGGRLCTESEWEYAARNGPLGRRFPWGDTPPTCYDAVFSDCIPWPAGPSIPCSKIGDVDYWGICDLVGNLSEWVEDDWVNNYDFNEDGWQPGGDKGWDAPSDGSAWVHSPRWDTRVVRGGAFDLPGDVLPAPLRTESSPERISAGVGIRCCRTVP